MESLPWHVQIIIFHGIGRDVIRSLGVRPGKIEIPEALCVALERSFGMRKKRNAVYIPIAQTTKTIVVFNDSENLSGVQSLHVGVYDKVGNITFLLSSNWCGRV